LTPSLKFRKFSLKNFFESPKNSNEYFLGQFFTIKNLQKIKKFISFPKWLSVVEISGKFKKRFFENSGKNCFAYFCYVLDKKKMFIFFSSIFYQVYSKIFSPQFWSKIKGRFLVLTLEIFENSL